MKTEILMAKQKVTEEALLVSEQRYDSLLAATSDYVYTVTVEHGRSVATYHGQGCEVITGFTAEELDQNPSLWYRMVHEEDRPAVLAQVARILKGEAPFPLEHRIIHKNGDIRWIRNVPVPKRDAFCQLLSYNGLISDVTQRKRTEQLLAVQYAVTRELAKAGALREALRPILKAICDSFPWDWAAFWSYNRDKKTLAVLGKDIVWQAINQSAQEIAFGCESFFRPFAIKELADLCTHSLEHLDHVRIAWLNLAAEQFNNTNSLFTPPDRHGARAK